MNDFEARVARVRELKAFPTMPALFDATADLAIELWEALQVAQKSPSPEELMMVLAGSRDAAFTIAAEICEKYSTARRTTYDQRKMATKLALLIREAANQSKSTLHPKEPK